jgi:hypothetical protein
MVLTAPSALSQAAAPLPPKWDPDYKAPRLADGTPSFDGVWSKASLTVLERTPQFKDRTVPPAVAYAIAQGNEQSADAANAPSDPDAGAPEAGGAGVGGYNRFWMDFGTGIGAIDGEFRSSWIIEPADGKLPYTEEGKAKAMAARDVMRENFDDPEVRSAGERCTVGFGSTGGPPMLNVLYNNHVEFYQDPDVVAILIEMNHDARMVRIDQEHRAAPLRQWLGDSVGHWEGDTLVVNTTNFHPDNSVRSAIRHYLYLSPDAKVEERFTRVADDVIHYEFSVDDPAIFTQTWKAEMPLWKAEGPIYEYACHEANYSLPGILAGARREESLKANGGSE